MVLPVAVEIAPPDSPREQVAVLLAACTRAKRGGECVLAAEAPAAGTSAVAIVTWQGGARALVEVGVRRGGRPQWRARSLDFDATRDDVLERWRAVGLVVGTLANEQVEPPGKAEAPTESEPSDPSNATRSKGPAPAASAEQRAGAARSPRKPQAGTAGDENADLERDADEGVNDDQNDDLSLRRRRPYGVRLDLGAAAGPALQAVRLGGLLRGELRLPRPLVVQLSARYLERPSGDLDLRAQWISLALGAGARFGSEQLEFAFAVDARGEYFGARAERGDDAEARTRWLSGVGAGATIAWMPSTTLGLFLGADGALMFGSTEVRVGAESLGRDGALRYAGEAGVRIRLR